MRRNKVLRRTGFARRDYPWARNPKPPKPLKPKSEKAKQREAIYKPVRRDYLRIHRWCRVCAYLQTIHGTPIAPATEVHHIRGRNGALLWDTRYFAACCFAHRLWPHDNPVEARAAGLLASARDWGVVPR